MSSEGSRARLCRILHSKFLEIWILLWVKWRRHRNQRSNCQHPLDHQKRKRVPVKHLLFIFLILIFTLFCFTIVLVLPYINMNPPRVYMSSQSWTPLPPPTPFHLSGSSPCTSPKHPVFCIEHRLAIHFLHDSIHVSMPFSQIIPPSPSPSESKSLFYTSASEYLFIRLLVISMFSLEKN